MLEAELNYIINQIGFDALLNIINRLKEPNASFTKKQLSEEFIKQLLENEELFVKESLSEVQYTALFEVVFSLDENCQRKEIANFIREYAEELITHVFKNIVILDDIYTQKVIEDLINYL